MPYKTKEVRMHIVRRWSRTQVVLRRIGAILHGLGKSHMARRLSRLARTAWSDGKYGKTRTG